MKRNQFREDLYHRLNEFTIFIAPLYDRLRDLPIYANHFLRQANKELNKSISGFDGEVMDIFNYYTWPGNIRELRNVIRRAVLVEQGSSISLKSLPHEITDSKNTRFNNHLQQSPPENLKDLKEMAEKELILATLEKARYNKSKAAIMLNIDRKTLYNKMKQYGLQM